MQFKSVLHFFAAILATKKKYQQERKRRTEKKVMCDFCCWFEVRKNYSKSLPKENTVDSACNRYS